MNLERISYALRVASDLARTGERLFDSLAASRRLTGWPVLLGVGVGVGIGALIFSEDARKHVKAWLREAEPTRLDSSPAADAKAAPSLRPS